LQQRAVAFKNQDFPQTGIGSNLQDSCGVNSTDKTEAEIRYFLTNCDQRSEAPYPRDGHVGDARAGKGGIEGLSGR
jgi:hypothetical protein